MKIETNYAFSWPLKSNLSLSNVLLRYFCPSQSHENTIIFLKLDGLCFLIQANQLILYYEDYLIFISPNIFGYEIYSLHNTHLLAPPPQFTYKTVRNGCSPERISVTTQTDQLDLSPSDPFSTTWAKWTSHRLETLSIQNMGNSQMSANFPVNVLVSFLWLAQNTETSSLKRKGLFWLLVCYKAENVTAGSSEWKSLLPS